MDKEKNIKNKKDDSNADKVDGLKENLEFNKNYQVPKEEIDEDEIGNGYQLSFIGKNYAKLLAGQKTETVIVPDKKHNESKENKESGNVFIAGDNLDALKHLENAYTGKVDVIYIDPPYNTGGDGFVYEDNFNFSDEQLKEKLGLDENEVRKVRALTGKSSHSAWLTFMYPRLVIAKRLLKDTGVIFISIDDNEQANLKLLCDEVFGEGNFVNNFVWVNNLKGRQIQGIGAAGTFETVLCYGKRALSIGQFQYNASFLKSIMPSTYKGFNYEVKEDKLGKYITSNELYNTNSAFNEQTRPNLVFDIYYRAKDGDIKFDDPKDKSYTKIEPHPNDDGTHKYHAYRWSKRKILAESYNLEFTKSGATYKVYSKRRDFDLTVVKNLITDITTAEGGTELKEMGIKEFDFPKPTNLIEFLLAIAGNKSSTVLDFFAGSATTADAVMQLNKEDGGNRKWILCTLDEETPINSEAQKAGFETIDEISRERIKRAGEKIKGSIERSNSKNGGSKQMTLLDSGDGETKATANVSGDNLDTGFKSFFLKTPKTATLKNIEEFDPSKEELIAHDMVTPFSAKDLGVGGGAKGNETLLTTWLIDDGYDFNTECLRLSLGNGKNPYTVYYAEEIARLYLIDNEGWGLDVLKDLLNKLGKNEINVNAVVIYGYSFTFKDLIELKNNLRANLDKTPKIIERY